MRYIVKATHGDAFSMFQVVDTEHTTHGHPNIIMGWDTESNPNAGWLAQDFCDRHNAEPWGTFTQRMLPILGVMWHRFPTRAEAEAFVQWAEFITKDDPHPCEAFVMGYDDAGYEVKVRNW